MKYKIVADKDYLAWYKDYLLHRLDSPAIEYKVGYREWWKDGFYYCLD